MSNRDRSFFELMGLLHDAPGDGAAWGRFLEALRAAISPDAVVLFATQPSKDRQGFLAGSGLGVSSVYLGDFLLPSVRHPSAAEVPLGAVHEVPADHPVFMSTALYREVLEPAGVLPGPGLFVVSERDAGHVQSAILVLPTSPRWKPDAPSRALLARLAPHVVIARRLHNSLSERQRDTEALLSVLDQLVIGVVFVDARLRVAFANKSAAELLGVAQGFAPAQSLAASKPDARTRALAPLLEGGPGSRIYREPRSGRALQVLSTSFRGRTRDGAAGARFVRALFIGDPLQPSGDPLGALQARYGLTRGETRLALLLLSGCSLEEAAQLLETSVGTSRGVLKKVFEKTGTNRQAALVRLLLSGFGQLRSDTAVARPA